MPTIRKPPTSIEYSVHRLALDVFHFISDRYQPILRWNTFPESLKSALLQQQVYTGIMHSEKIPKPNSDETLKKAVKYQFIIPMWALKYTDQAMPLPENYLICYEPDELTDHQISLMCWNSFFQLLAFSVDRRKLSRAWDTINDMVPTDVMQELLSAKSLTLDVFTAWTGGSKGTLVEQKRKEKKKKYPFPHPWQTVPRKINEIPNKVLIITLTPNQLITNMISRFTPQKKPAALLSGEKSCSESIK